MLNSWLPWIQSTQQLCDGIKEWIAQHDKISSEEKAKSLRILKDEVLSYCNKWDNKLAPSAIASL